MATIEFAGRAGIGAVEIERLAPFVVIAIGEIGRGEQFEVVSVWADVVVDDIENDGDPERVGVIDETAEIDRTAVEPSRCEQVDTVIPPAETAREVRHGHDFEASDTEFGQSRQLSLSRFPAALRGEGADMHLVDDELLARPSVPRIVCPVEVLGIDDLRRFVRSTGLKSRRWVG